MGEHAEGPDRKLSNKPYVTFVWAEDSNGLIGKEGHLPWNLPADMKFFKEVTIGDVVVMGRKTYESIPNRPLKNRINIVLTNNKDYQADGAVICHTKEDVLTYLKSNQIEQPIHVIGGISAFEMFKDEVNYLYRTVIDETFDGDTYMTSMDYKNFRCIDVTDGILDERNKHPHRFLIYERKQFVDLFPEDVEK